MLKGLPAFMGADLLWVLAAMGHGDRLALVDRNFPGKSTAAQSLSGRHIELLGTNVVEAAHGILQLFPLDTFVDSPLACMAPVHETDAPLPVQADMLAACEAAEGRKLVMTATERLAFYEAAKQCFAVVHTTESRPYGCFILTKGVVFD
jgi:L-fucose mutarotase